MKNWGTAGIVLVVVLACALRISYKQHLEATREAGEHIQLPSDADVVSVRRIPPDWGRGTDIVFRLPQTRSIDTWLDIVCRHNPDLHSGAVWLSKPNHRRETNCCDVKLWYDQRRNVYEYYDWDSECSCT